MPEQASDSGQVYPDRDATDTLSLVPADPSDPDWRLHTLRQTVGERIAQQFFWKAETDTIQTYEHRLTYRYVHVDSVTGQFYNQQRAAISAEQALTHALPSFDLSPAPAKAVSTVSTVSMMLAPIVLEPDLAPFVRRDEAEPQPSAALGEKVSSNSAAGAAQSVSRFYENLWARFLALGTFAKSASVPSRERAREAHGSLQTKELSVAAFTRRAA